MAPLSGGRAQAALPWFPRPPLGPGASRMELATPPERSQAEEIRLQLEEEGVNPAAPPDEQLCSVWSLFLRGREELRSTTIELEKLRQQQTEEMREVESYVGHVRSLTETRDALVTRYEEENEQLRTEVTRLQLEQESQQKEVGEMLAQEGLPHASLGSSPSEQVAYLLVERSRLLETMEALEPRVGFNATLGNLCATRLQEELDQIRRTLEDELREQRESMQRSIEQMNKCHAEELAKEHTLRTEAEKDRKEAQGEILRLTEALEASGNPECSIQLDQDLGFPFLPGYLDQDEEGMLDSEEEVATNPENAQALHKRCRQALEGVEGQNLQLRHKLSKLEKEHEELVERNEELESLLGETQNQTREERQQVECQVDGLHRKISHLEAELCQVQKAKSEGSLREATKEEVDLLENKLLEEREWRKQLSGDLEATQKALKEEKKELQNSKSELLRLYSEIQVLRGAAEERDFLHEKMQQENAPLQTKGPPPTEKLLRQQEELQQMRRDLQRVQNLCSSAEKELRYEREKNLELQKHNILLQQESVTTKAELKQAQQRLSEASKACSSLTSQWELSQQKAKELELEALRLGQVAKQLSGLQERLEQEKVRASKAEKKIAELQQKLKESHHQLRLCEAQVSGKKALEEEAAELREKEAQALRQAQEEQRKRKALDLRAEELQQQARLQKEKEAQLVRKCAELQVRAQQQEARLRVLEEEKKTLSNEHLRCQKYSQKLSEQLLTLQREKETLHEEYGHILKQVDTSIRKHNERQLRHKAKLRRAKETFICEVKQRNIRIRQLEDELALSKGHAEKDRALVQQISSENERLLQEKRRLLQQAHDLEEAKRSSKSALSAAQNRAQFLDEENRRLQERVSQLAAQVGILERTLRNIHSHSLEELQSIGFSECRLQSKILPLPNISFAATELLEPSSPLKALQDSADGASLSPAPSSQPSEIGYLNVASPAEPAHLPDEEEQLDEAFSCDDRV
ncbi:coiled-coil domain-containing protein 30 isoform X1 [Anolis sagrei]|uniref:coiled-coil domain-containing protein 30 isoform X1 n=1 Tax=Anolis sagrei TaxID=38937 RepID=UPI003520E532